MVTEIANYVQWGTFNSARIFGLKIWLKIGEIWLKNGEIRLKIGEIWLKIGEIWLKIGELCLKIGEICLQNDQTSRFLAWLHVRHCSIIIQ